LLRHLRRSNAVASTQPVVASDVTLAVFGAGATKWGRDANKLVKPAPLTVLLAESAVKAPVLGVVLADSGRGRKSGPSQGGSV